MKSLIEQIERYAPVGEPLSIQHETDAQITVLNAVLIGHEIKYTLVVVTPQFLDD